MYFYEVWVRSNHYHGSSGLSYSSKHKLAIGQLVTVPLRNEIVAAVVIRNISKPTISIKEIDHVLELPPLPQASLKLMYWLKKYYPSPVGIITQQFIPLGLSTRLTTKLEPETTNNDDLDLPSLTIEQNKALKAMSKNDTYLLHGRTGSGKTRLYMDLAREALSRNRSVIVLTPEISLTPQLENNFNSHFLNKVVLLHSNLTAKQRAQRWIALLGPDPKVVIGPRSAIFSPLTDVGLIIMDEEHEPAYKQEQAPYYQTIRVAAQLRNIHDAKLVLGSATPLVSDYYMAETLNKPILRLKSLAQNESKTNLKISVVDCKDRTLFNRSTTLSQPLIEAIETALENGYQTLLYLNRRGTARVIVCETCDWQAYCPRCDLPLVYHGDNHTLRCHICGFVTSGPVSCPKCKNPTIKYLSIGTKAVVDEVNRLFANARVKRFDADNLKADRLEQHYDSIKEGGLDIIIGTQMLAKGLDLPKLSVVGVLLADTSLQLPDFSANERTFQLLEQVVGRVGRGHVDGQAFVQTYQPDNKTIAAALTDNWDSFYKDELNEREQFLFPPFVHLLKLSVQRTTQKSAELAAHKLINTIPKGIIFEGPAPAFHEKQSNKYRWQIIAKAKERSRLLELIANLPAGWTYDIDPADLM